MILKQEGATWLSPGEVEDELAEQERVIGAVQQRISG